MEIKILKHTPVAYSPKITAELSIRFEGLGLVIHGVKVIESEKGTFYGLPSQTQWDPETRSCIMENGRKKYFPVCEFSDRYDQDAFNIAMNEAMAHYNNTSQPATAAAPPSAAASQFDSRYQTISDDLPF
jgi:DNA-binding cell septation regulator SpoVG